jgi:hypothetical protein
LPSGASHLFDYFKLVLIRDPKHRPDHILFATPRRCDVGDRFIASLQSLPQNAGDHREWNQEHQNKRTDPDQLDLLCCGASRMTAAILATAAALFRLQACRDVE